MELKNAAVLVTGANRGIGKALVQELLERGVRKIYAAGRKLESLEDLQALDSERIVPLELDITDLQQVETAARDASDVNLLVNNAGVASLVGLLESDDDTFRHDMETNYFGTLKMMQAFVPVLIKNGSSAVANVLSVVSLANMPSLGGYSASKAALYSLTQGYRAALGQRGVQVFGIYPGPVDTDMARDLTLDKTPARAVAHEIAGGIEADKLDIFPDPMAKSVEQTYYGDPKALEQQFGEY